MVVYLHSFLEHDSLSFNKVVAAVANYQAQNESRDGYNRDTEQDEDWLVVGWA